MTPGGTVYALSLLVTMSPCSWLTAEPNRRPPVLSGVFPSESAPAPQNPGPETTPSNSVLPAWVETGHCTPRRLGSAGDMAPGSKRGAPAHDVAVVLVPLLECRDEGCVVARIRQRRHRVQVMAAAYVCWCAFRVVTESAEKSVGDTAGPCWCAKEFHKNTVRPMSDEYMGHPRPGRTSLRTGRAAEVL